MGGSTFGRIHKKNCCCGTCCPGRCFPKDCLTGELATCDNPLPLTLTVDLTATPSSGSSTCFNGSGTLTFLTPLDEGGLCCWEGRIEGTCVDCNGVTFDWYVDMTLCCGANGWIVTASPGLPCVMGNGTSVVVDPVCDPVLLEGCFADMIVGCVVACLDTMPPTPGPEYELCFSIYETP